MTRFLGLTFLISLSFNVLYTLDYSLLKAPICLFPDLLWDSLLITLFASLPAPEVSILPRVQSRAPFSFHSIYIFSVLFYSSPCLQGLPINRQSKISVSSPPLSPEPQTEYLQMPTLGPYPMVSQKSQTLKYRFVPCLHLLALKTSSSSSLPFPDTWYHIPPKVTLVLLD